MKIAFFGLTTLLAVLVSTGVCHITQLMIPILDQSVDGKIVLQKVQKYSQIHCGILKPAPKLDFPCPQNNTGFKADLIHDIASWQDCGKK